MITFLSYFLPFVPIILTITSIGIELLIFRKINLKAQRILLTVFYSLLFASLIGYVVFLAIYDMHNGWQWYVAKFGAWLYLFRNFIIKILSKFFKNNITNP